MFGHIIPLLIQVTLQNDPHYENYRTSAAAVVIYIASIVSILTQIFLAGLEIKSRLRSEKFECMDDLQNVIDNVAILYSITYMVLRIVLPAGSYMNPNYAHNDHDDMGKLYFAMPILHFMELILTSGQAMFYLMLDTDRAKFIQLFWKSFVDIIPFLIIFALIILQTILMLHVLGATFDTGGNYLLDDSDTPEYDGYDANHNAY